MWMEVNNASSMKNYDEKFFKKYIEEGDKWYEDKFYRPKTSINRQNQLLQGSFDNDYCKFCNQNPKNNPHASGFCHCILGNRIVY